MHAVRGACLATPGALDPITDGPAHSSLRISFGRWVHAHPACVLPFQTRAARMMDMAAALRLLCAPFAGPIGRLCWTARRALCRTLPASELASSFVGPTRSPPSWETCACLAPSLRAGSSTRSGRSTSDATTISTCDGQRAIARSRSRSSPTISIKPTTSHLSHPPTTKGSPRSFFPGIHESLCS